MTAAEHDIKLVLDLIKAEYKKAEKEFPPMNTGHEGWAIIKEELDELWEEVRKYPHQDRGAMTMEAFHVAAMAIRFILDLCLPWKQSN